jgi:hypothetical protein
MTASADPLREFVILVSDLVDHLFSPPRQLMAHFLIERPDGQRSLLACPMSDASEETAFRLGVPSMLRRSSAAARWCFFCEAWSAAYGPGENAWLDLPKERPTRIEVVTFHAETLSGAQLTATRQIFRNGDHARLLPLVFQPANFVMAAPAGAEARP